MFSAILAILALPFSDLSKTKGLQFKPFTKILFWIFVVDIILLMSLGSCHVEEPFVLFGQVTTIVYFIYFTGAMLVVSSFENYSTIISSNKEELININSNKIPKNHRNFHISSPKQGYNGRIIYHHDEFQYIYIEGEMFQYNANHGPKFTWNVNKERWDLKYKLNWQSKGHTAPYQDSTVAVEEARRRFEANRLDYWARLLKKVGINPYTGIRYNEEVPNGHSSTCTCFQCEAKRRGLPNSGWPPNAEPSGRQDGGIQKTMFILGALVIAFIILGLSFLMLNIPISIQLESLENIKQGLIQNIT